MEYVEVPTKVSQRFAPNGLQVTTSLIAAKHDFIFENQRVTVQLPPLDKENTPFDQRRVSCYKWLSQGHVPLEYHVFDLNVEVEIEKPVRVPSTMLEQQYVHRDRLQPQEQSFLDGLVTEADGVALRALTYWLRVLRWKSKIGNIGAPRVEQIGSSGGATLYDRQRGHRLWVQPHLIIGMAAPAVEPAAWGATQDALTAGKTPPIWFDYLHDSEMRIRNKDLTGGILSLAIALEVNVRTLFSHDLHQLSVQPVLLEVFDLTNLRTLLNRMRQLKHWDANWEKVVDLSALNKVMNYRDKVMHSASTQNLNEKELRQLNKAVKDFGYLSCDFLGLN